MHMTFSYYINIDKPVSMHFGVSSPNLGIYFEMRVEKSGEMGGELTLVVDSQ